MSLDGLCIVAYKMLRKVESLSGLGFSPHNSLEIALAYLSTPDVTARHFIQSVWVIYFDSIGAREWGRLVSIRKQFSALIPEG